MEDGVVLARPVDEQTHRVAVITGIRGRAQRTEWDDVFTRHDERFPAGGQERGDEQAGGRRG